MQFLRIYILFAFFAFSIARADCVDFEIFANKVSLGCEPVVYTSIIYGNPLTLSISPTSGNIEWRATDIVVIGTGSAYIPIITESNKTITYYVERNGISKTINVYVQARASYIVSFNTDGGTPLNISPQSVLKDSLAKKPAEILIKTGYDFAGWDFNFSTPITKDTIIYAKWNPKILTVFFNSNGGSPVASQNVYYNSIASIPVPPTKVGYDFDGWDFDFSTPITANITIRAKWKERQYIIDLSFVEGIIKFTPGFYLDSSSKQIGKQRDYFVDDTSFCTNKKPQIHLTLKEPKIVLKKGRRDKNGSLYYDEYIPYKSIDENGFLHYDIDFNFRPGLDSLIYELALNDGSHSGFYTILIETPIPFDSIVGQKWNNVLFVNNDTITNGGYKFKDFKWFKNDKEIQGGNLQFYSAGPNIQNILYTKDTYKVTMHTTDDIRISTCKGNPKIVPAPLAQIPTFKKQVFGIREKTLKSGSKIYNLNGKLTKETPAGVYIVKE